MKILLLEDDLELCKNIKISLEKENYMVDCCNDGETAMLYALNTDYSYDLAIVDRMLPIIDGLTIIKSMRKKGAGQKLASEYKKNEYFRSWRYSFSHVMGYNKKNN